MFRAPIRGTRAAIFAHRCANRTRALGKLSTAAAQVATPLRAQLDILRDRVIENLFDGGVRSDLAGAGATASRVHRWRRFAATSILPIAGRARPCRWAGRRA